MLYHAAMDFSQNDRLTYSEETFSKLNLIEAEVRGKEFDKCRFEKSSFLQCDFQACRFIDCTFSGCMISATKFKSSTLVDTLFTDSKIMGIDWTRIANARGFQFTKCELLNLGFGFMKLPNMIMTDCAAHEVDLMETDCTGAVFDGTDFHKSLFLRTNLTNASFRRAYNYAIDFHHNTLKNAVFTMPEAASLLQYLEIVIE